MSVREMVRDAQREIMAGELSPMRAAELEMRLTALLGNCSEEIREADMAYAQVYLGCLNSAGAANRAKIQAQITPEYMRQREAKDTHELVLQLIRSMRNYCRAAGEEMRLAR